MTTVMVVEDDASFLNRFCKIVASDAELELFAAVADVASARQAMSKMAPDVLLTDLGLPDGSGIDLIRETARHYPDTDIMVITVFCDEDHVLASIEPGRPATFSRTACPMSSSI
jgi:DNA-binding NarL/FixJ family response regulator